MDVKIFIKQKKGLFFEEEVGRFTYSCCIESNTVEVAIDNCVIDFENQRICSHFSPKIEKILNLPEEGYYAERSFNAYVALLYKFNIELPATSSNKPHWKPTENGEFFYKVNELGGCFCTEYQGLPENAGEEMDFTLYDNYLISQYNAFPTQELAEKAANLSKLDRLILLWQYSNDCLFKPEWRVSSVKYYITYYWGEKKIVASLTRIEQANIAYFESKAQAEKFIIRYEKEIKELLGIGDKP